MSSKKLKMWCCRCCGEFCPLIIGRLRTLCFSSGENAFSGKTESLRLQSITNLEITIYPGDYNL